MKNLFPLLAFALLPACATLTPPSMLAQFNNISPLNPTQLQRDCDLLDPAACFFAGRPTPPEAPALARVPILQGPAGPQRAIFTALLSESQRFRWFLFQSNDRSLKRLPVAQTAARPHSPWRLEQLELFNLDSQKTYTLIATDEFGQMQDIRTFRTLPGETHADLRFAMLAGTNDDGAHAEDESAWKSLLERQPRLVIAVGNNVYARPGAGDATLDYLWDRNVETRRNFALFRAPQLIPVVATWDDQDFGTLQGNSQSPHVDEAREMQKAFFPLLADNITVKNGPGVSKALLISGQLFILMDDRSFRDPDSRPPACANLAMACEGRDFAGTSDSAHFGRLQRNWATDLVSLAQGPVWLLSGDSWFNGGLNPSVFEGNHPRAFELFRQGLAAAVKDAAKAHHHFPIFFAGSVPKVSSERKVEPFANYHTEEFDLGPALRNGHAGDMRFFQASLEKGFQLRTELSRGGVMGKAQAIEIKDASPPTEPKPKRKHRGH